MRVSGTLGLLMVLISSGCGMQDVDTPVPQPDTVIFGRIAAIALAANDPQSVEVEIVAGLPETMSNVLKADGKPVPQLGKDLQVTVKVTSDSLCVVDMVPTDIDAFRVGHEVAVVPLAGTSAMVGSKRLLATAAELFLFSDYQVRYLAGSLETLGAEVIGASDPKRINSGGLEMSPIPLQGGKVLYFAAGLNASPRPDVQAAPVGAFRVGMGSEAAPAAWAVGGYRPYRTQLGKDGWAPPQPVVLSGIPEDASARFTWVRQNETEGLVEVLTLSGTRELWEVRRDDARLPWGAPQRVMLPSGASVGDAQRFGPTLDYLIWTAYEAESSDLWLREPGKEGQILEPRVNTLGPEFAPRVGPRAALYFCRGERQLLFENQVVREVRLPGKQRRPLLEAAPVADGSWVFCRVPRYTPGQLDWDIAVVPVQDGAWGAPVLVDEWRPR